MFTDSTWSAAPDHAAPEPAGPVTEPAHPKPAATARTVAAGVLFAVLATALAASLVLVVTSLRLLGSGDARLELGGPPVVLLAVAFATATVAALLFLTRDWAPLRIGTMALAFVVSVAWPLSGNALPAALIALVAVGLALGRDRRSASGRRVTGWPAIGASAAAALVLAIAGAAIADTHPAAPAGDSPKPSAATKSTPDAQPRDDAAPRADATTRTDAQSRDDGTPRVDEAMRTDAQPRDDATSRVDAATTTDAQPPDDATPRVDAATTSDAQPRNGAEPGADEQPGGDVTTKANAQREAGAVPTTDATPKSGAAVEGAPSETSPAAEANGAPLVQAEGTPVLGGEAPETTASVDAADAERFVRDYYRALDERRFEDAWKTLSPAVKRRFGGFTGWKAGYAKTLYSKPRRIAITASGGDVTVTHLLVARDKGCATEGRFDVTWMLSRRGEQWSVTALSASAAGANTTECR